MVHKYTELPFTCKDIETFPSEVVSTAMDPITSTWKWIKGIFVSEEEIVSTLENSSEILENKEEKVWFFSKITNYIKTETDINWELTRWTCEYYLSYFKNPEYKWIEMIAVVVLYVLSIWVINTLLLFVTIVWLLLFIVLRFFHVYEYKTEKVDKESLV